MNAPDAPTPVLQRAHALFARYDVLVCDVWGVIHDGHTAYEGAGDAFARFRSAGGTVVLLSNAPMPSAWVARVLDEKRVRRDSWDAIVSSGDIALAHIAERGYSRVLHIGTPRDLPLFETMQATRVAFAEAEAIVCTGLEHDRTETAETYRPLLEAAHARRLPLICANPDLIVDVGGDLLPCAGVIAELYEAIGGPVYWAGKPFAPAYELMSNVAARLRGSSVPRQRMLAIGDAVRTDIAGAGAYGIDSLFIAQGIHRDAVIRNGTLEKAALTRLLAGQIRAPVAAMISVTW
jgi:HAD superfamily hydrolase (TIGR01459 family)